MANLSTTLAIPMLEEIDDLILLNSRTRRTHGLAARFNPARVFSAMKRLLLIFVSEG